jgi:hypothetical protein
VRTGDLEPSNDLCREVHGHDPLRRAGGWNSASLIGPVRWRSLALRNSRSDAQSCALHVVPRERVGARLPDDTDDRRSRQCASRGIFAFALTLFKQACVSLME